MSDTPELYFKNQADWRVWLEQNYDKYNEIWMVYYKKHTGKPSLKYAEALEEALCFGWIDSKIQRIDDERYRQIFTPRKPKSLWSDVNKKKVAKLIKEGKMTPAGLEIINIAKKKGNWKNSYGSGDFLPLPEDLEKALKNDKTAHANFFQFAPSYRKMYIGWIESAKRQETREKRISEVVRRSAINQKPGML
ncbi:MAG: YdeI/OmpD-associated family protein [Bacteroidales bacterium]|nr:YdeI/OmpD-associated family protein [Bacteroidales bacterium]